MMPEITYVLAASYADFREWCNRNNKGRRTGHVFLGEPEQVMGSRMDPRRFLTLPGAERHRNHKALQAKIASVTSKAAA